MILVVPSERINMFVGYFRTSTKDSDTGQLNLANFQLLSVSKEQKYYEQLLWKMRFESVWTGLSLLTSVSRF